VVAQSASNARGEEIVADHGQRTDRFAFATDLAMANFLRQQGNNKGAQKFYEDALDRDPSKLWLES
jgi:hypothetical protein